MSLQFSSWQRMTLKQVIEYSLLSERLSSSLFHFRGDGCDLQNGIYKMKLDGEYRGITRKLSDFSTFCNFNSFNCIKRHTFKWYED